MITQVNIHEAKTHLSRYLAQVAAGGEVIIARNGKPIAKLSGMDEAPPKRKIHFLNIPADALDHGFWDPITEEDMIGEGTNPLFK